HPASPLARRMAREQAIELASVQGTGTDGAVLAADVRAALADALAPGIATSTTPTEPAVTTTHAAAASDAIAVPRAWQVMAERMAASWTSAPHFVVMREVEVS